MESACVFCAIAAGRSPAHVVYDDEATIAFLDINPATDGHTLVIPRAHHADWWEMPEELVAPVMRTVHRVGLAIRDAFAPAGLNLFQATRAAAFQTVFHVHVHVIPRYAGDGLRPPWRISAGEPASLARAAAGVRSAAQASTQRR